MENILEKIKARVDIVDYIGQSVQLKKMGRNFKGLCPFHKEKSPSFVVSQDRQIWHCFGACADGGDVVKFVMKSENIGFVEAVQELAQKLGISIDTQSYQDQEWKQRERLIHINTLASNYYEYVLHSTSIGEKAREYLKGRLLTEGIIKTFQIGYAPQSWDSLVKYFAKKHIAPQELFQAGLLVKSDNGHLYDRFRGRIMFPIKDIRGNIIGFSGRVLDSQVKEAKYINTPESTLYHKRESLYAIALSKDAIRKEGNAIIMEGEFDVISSYQHGIEHVVGIKGTALTSEQLMLLKRLTSKITLALDKDNAGIEAIQRGIHEADKLEFEIYVMVIPEGKDPDEAVHKNPTLYKHAATHPIPVYDFLMDLYVKKYPKDDAFSKKKIGEEIIPFLARIQNPIIQSYYVKKMSEFLTVSEDSILTLINKEKFKKKITFIPQSIVKNNKKQQVPRDELLQRYLLSYLLQNNNIDEVFAQYQKVLSEDDFSIPALKKIIEALAEFIKATSEKVDVAAFAKSLPPELQAVFDELYLFDIEDDQFASSNIDRLLLEIKKSALKRTIANLVKGDEEQNNTVLQFTQELKEVEKKIASL